MMTTELNAGAPGALAARDREFFGHPLGLTYIVFTEAFERFSFYGMQALLVLYMATYLLLPGNVDGVLGMAGFETVLEGIFGDLTSQALATQIFGLYIGLVYFMPVVGGLIGDRLLGQTNSVMLGALTMAVGHFLMAFESLFLIALLLLIIGAGLLKGNLAAQVGALYDKTDQRRDSAFSIYSVAINVGAFVAPLICGTLGELYGWHYGFGVAGVGMVIGTIIYYLGRGYLPDDILADRSNVGLGLNQSDVKKITALIIVFVIAALFWTAQSQVWNTYPLWIRERVDRDVFDLLVPVTWFQSLDSLAVLVLAPVVLMYWGAQRQRSVEPSDILKIFYGCAVFALATAWLAGGEWFAGDAQVALFWPAVFHFICAIGFLYVWPVVLALVSKTAPASINAMMVGAAYLAIFVGSTASGWLGRFYEQMTPEMFWLMHGGIVLTGAAMAIVLRGVLVAALKD